MKKNAYSISIANPCHESWQRMTAGEKGRFCASCAKHVIDLTQLPDHEIIKLLGSSSGGKICGRLHPSQANRPLAAPYAQRPGLGKLLAGILLLSSASAIAAGTVAPIGIAINAGAGASGHSALESQTRTLSDSTKNIIRGTVRDSVTHEEIPFASVYIKAINKGVMTDVAGDFSLEVPDSAFKAGAVTLQVNYVGYDPREIICHKNDLGQPARTFLLYSAPALMGEIIMVEPVKKNRRRKR